MKRFVDNADVFKILAFLAATKQLYEWFTLSIFLSVCPSVHLSHLFHYVPIIAPSWNLITDDGSDIHAKGQGQRSKVKAQRAKPDLAVSGP